MSSERKSMKHTKRKSITKKAAIRLAKRLFASSEIEAWERALGVYLKARLEYDKARLEYDKARIASDWMARFSYDWKALFSFDKALDDCIRTIVDYEVITINGEHRAFNIKAADYDGVYCYNLFCRQLWRYDGIKCPKLETVEKIEISGFAKGRIK
jgi:hypothetical protein